MIRTLAIATLTLVLAGCAVAPTAESERFLADGLFAPPSRPVARDEVFTASEAMRRYVAEEIGEIPGARDRQRALLAALRDRGGLRLEYDADYTRNAAQAFEARRGNCLSLVIMTAALAREMGLAVSFNALLVEESWSRQGDTYFSTGHVNITLGNRPPKTGSRIDDGERLTVDFLPPADLRGVRWREIEESTVLAMYMNNRAAESLVAGSVDDAYWFVREAIAFDRGFLPAWNTLGVVYRRAGHLAHAERVLAGALERNPRNTSVMTNLANVLAAQGRAQEAQALEARMAQLEPEPPFAFFDRGLVAMRAGDYATARDLFAREVDRAPYYHEFHFWLAQALAALGEDERARRHLAAALENSTTPRDRDRYAAKLRHIKSASARH
jgi:Tfp pilus assembly protein PilF